MTKVKLLAFLLCERATRGSDGKVTVHDIFDRIVLPQIPVPQDKDSVFLVYYKVQVLEPCVISLRVLDPQGNEMPGGNWHDSIEQAGLTQSLWALRHSLFSGPGTYTLQLSQRDDINPRDATRRIPGPPQPEFKVGKGNLVAGTRILATAPLILDQQGK